MRQAIFAHRGVAAVAELLILRSRFALTPWRSLRLRLARLKVHQNTLIRQSIFAHRGVAAVAELLILRSCYALASWRSARSPRGRVSDYSCSLGFLSIAGDFSTNARNDVVFERLADGRETHLPRFTKVTSGTTDLPSWIPVRFPPWSRLRSKRRAVDRFA